jgi:transposase-like protein
MLEHHRPNSRVRCKFCQSTDVVKNGLRNGTQYWLCTKCGRGFVDNHALPKMQYPMSVVAKAVFDYYGGHSLNTVAEGIGQHTGNKPSDSNVYAWVQKLTKVAKDEAKKHIPQVGDTWIADETVLKVAGRNVWLYDIIDEKTRYLLATRLAFGRTTKDAQLLMEEASKNAGGKIPKTVITDKNYSYLDGIEQAFGADTEHIQTKPFTKEVNTELIERFHGTVKDRTKVMRGLKTIESALEYIDGWLIYYNYFRPHESLDKKTPAEQTNIKYPFRNWLDVIKTLTPAYSVGSEVVKSSRQRIVRKSYRKRSKPSSKGKSDSGIRQIR